MPDLVAEMPQQGTIGLMEFGAPAFAFCVVSFHQRDGNQAAIVTGHYPGSLRRIGQETESEPVLRVLGPVLQRQAQPEQGVEQVMLRRLDLLPASLAGGV